MLQDGPQVLHEISFEIKSGEQVGIGESTRNSTLYKLLLNAVRSWQDRERQSESLDIS